MRRRARPEVHVVDNLRIGLVTAVHLSEQSAVAVVFVVPRRSVVENFACISAKDDLPGEGNVTASDVQPQWRHRHQLPCFRTCHISEGGKVRSKVLRKLPILVTLQTAKQPQEAFGVDCEHADAVIFLLVRKGDGELVLQINNRRLGDVLR